MQFHGAPTHEGRYDVNGMISNMVLINSGFHTQKNFSEITCNLGTRPQTAAQLCPRLNKFKNFGFGGAKLLALPARPRLGPDLTPASLFYDLFYLSYSAAYLVGILHYQFDVLKRDFRKIQLVHFNDQSWLYVARYNGSLRAERSGNRIPVGGEIFCTCPDRPWGPPGLLYKYHVFFPWLERPARGVDHPPHLEPRCKKEYSYASTPPSAPLWPVLG